MATEAIAKRGGGGGGGRRKKAAKSDIFETTFQQPGLFLNIAPELFLNILSYCSQKDLYRLIQTCKDFYNVGYPLLWSTLQLYPNYYPPWPRPSWSTASLSYESLVSLTQITRAEKAKKNELGYKYIRNLKLSGHCREQSWRVSSYRWKGLLDVLSILESRFKSGNMNVRNIEFVIDDAELGHHGPKRFQRFMRAVKQYSETKSQNELTVKLDYSCNSSDMRMLSDFLDYSKLTDLSLSFPDNWRGRVWDSTARWTIIEQTNLLSAATNLRYLCLLARGTGGALGDPPPLPAPLDLLHNLQTALSGLTKLQTLHVSGFLWDPSLFPIPPPAVKTVKYTDVHTASRAWWRQFAACEFLNVDSMTIDYPAEAARRRLEWWRGIDDGLNARDHGGYDGLQHWKFEIKNVAVTGLKEFVYQDRRDYLAPIDLVDCMVRKNRGIREKWGGPLADRYENTLLVECNARLLEPLRKAGISQVGRIVRERFRNRYWDGENGQDEEEEIRLFTTEYAKEIIKWIEESMETKAAGN